MFTIYYQPHKRRIREAAFVQHLVQTFQQAQIVHGRFNIDPKYLDCFVQKEEIVAKLEVDNLLPNQRRQNCLELLANCPSQIKIALNPNRISFDVVVERDKQIYYWEFHEEQHRNLGVNRLQQIYNAADNEIILVPRYLQRFIRDIWRVKCFRPYTIVWYDWFAQYQHEYQPELREGFHEFHLPNDFSFRNFLI